MRTALRDSDTVARLGGDEFAVLLPAIYSEAALTLINLEDIPGAPLGSDRQWFENHGFPVQKDPLRRLRCGYLIGAFEAEQFPFQPNTWDYYLDELSYNFV